MYTTDTLQILGRGATATVYLLDANRIIKVFNPEYATASVQYEAKLSAEISKTSIRAPRYLGVAKADDHDAILTEYISGDILLDRIVTSSPRMCVKLIKKMVKTHKTIHNANCTTITSQYDRFTYLLNTTTLSTLTKQTILRYLQSNGQHTQVCHGDFHPGNIIIDAQNGLYTIDWMNCYYGNPLGDVVRSYITLISPYIPFKAPGIIRLIFLLYKRFLGSLYLHEYRKGTKITANDINAWIPIIAAGRLADNVPHEGEWLAKLIEKKMKYLAKASQ